MIPVCVVTSKIFEGQEICIIITLYKLAEHKAKKKSEFNLIFFKKLTENPFGLLRMSLKNFCLYGGAFLVIGL